MCNKPSVRKKPHSACIKSNESEKKKEKRKERYKRIYDSLPKDCPPRNKQIISDLANGMSQSEIAKRENLTRQGVELIVIRYDKESPRYKKRSHKRGRPKKDL